MRLPVLPIALLALASAPERSRGYAGFTPVGLDGYTAFASFDCKRINADPRRSRFRVPVSPDCRLSIPSPKGGLTVDTEPARDGTTTLHATGGFQLQRIDPPTVLLWNPNGSGFVLNGGEGSGQVSHLRYFYRAQRRWLESRRLGEAASSLFLKQFACNAGERSYTNTSGWDWTSTGLLRVIVQEGVHSEGCILPHRDRNVLFEVIGDPVTGRVISAHEAATLP